MLLQTDVFFLNTKINCTKIVNLKKEKKNMDLGPKRTEQNENRVWLKICRQKPQVEPQVKLDGNDNLYERLFCLVQYRGPYIESVPVDFANIRGNVRYVPGQKITDEKLIKLQDYLTSFKQCPTVSIGSGTSEYSAEFKKKAADFVRNGGAHYSLTKRLVEVVEIKDPRHHVKFCTPPELPCYGVRYIGEEIPQHHKEPVIFGQYGGLVKIDNSSGKEKDNNMYAFNLNFDKWTLRRRWQTKDQKDVFKIPKDPPFIDSETYRNELVFVNDHKSLVRDASNDPRQNCLTLLVYCNHWPYILLVSKPGSLIKYGDELLADFGAAWFLKMKKKILDFWEIRLRDCWHNLGSSAEPHTRNSLPALPTGSFVRIPRPLPHHKLSDETNAVEATATGEHGPAHAGSKTGAQGSLSTPSLNDGSNNTSHLPTASGPSSLYKEAKDRKRIETGGYNDSHPSNCAGNHWDHKLLMAANSTTVNADDEALAALLKKKVEAKQKENKIQSNYVYGVRTLSNFDPSQRFSR